MADEKPKSMKDPRERVRELAEESTATIPIYDARPAPHNNMRGAGTYVDIVHGIYNKDGEELGWYGWSEKEKAVIINVPTTDEHGSHYYHVFAEDIIGGIIQALIARRRKNNGPGN